MTIPLVIYPKGDCWITQYCYFCVFFFFFFFENLPYCVPEWLYQFISCQLYTRVSYAPFFHQHFLSFWPFSNSHSKMPEVISQLFWFVFLWWLVMVGTCSPKSTCLICGNVYSIAHFPPMFLTKDLFADP